MPKMIRMNFGFDLDGIFIDYPPFVPAWLINWFFKDHTKKNLAYRFPGKFEQKVRRFSHHAILRPPIEENIALVRELASKREHTLYLVSGRFSFLKDITYGLLKKYQLDKIFNGVFINFEDNQPHIFKDGVVKRIKLHRYVDDDLPLLTFLASENPKIKFFWLNKRLTKALGKNLWAITKLSDILT